MSFFFLLWNIIATAWTHIAIMLNHIWRDCFKSSVLFVLVYNIPATVPRRSDLHFCSRLSVWRPRDEADTEEADEVCGTCTFDVFTRRVLARVLLASRWAFCNCPWEDGKWSLALTPGQVSPEVFPPAERDRDPADTQLRLIVFKNQND